MTANSSAYDLAYYIRNVLGKGTALGVDVFCNDLPNAPDAAISVFQYGGRGSDRGMGIDTQPLENSSLQVDVRDANPQTAESICYAIYEALDELGVNVTINGTVYTWLRPMQPPFLLERDASKRVTYIFNMECQRIRP